MYFIMPLKKKYMPITKVANGYTYGTSVKVNMYPVLIMKGKLIMILEYAGNCDGWRDTRVRSPVASVGVGATPDRLM